MAMSIFMGGAFASKFKRFTCVLKGDDETNQPIMQINGRTLHLNSRFVGFLSKLKNVRKKNDLFILT